jgi:hypothetical protein
MYYWTGQEELTHVVDVRSRPPSEPLFGYLSLCEEVLAPKEGEDFKLEEPLTGEVPCPQCEKRRGRHEDDGEMTLMRWDEHLVLVDRDSNRRLRHAHLVCDGPLHRRLDFEPPEFSGDLHTQVEQVCEDCWDNYRNRQWSPQEELAQLAVNVWTDDGEETYFASSVEAQGAYEERARLLLVSKDGLEEEVPRERVDSISLTRSENIVY